MDVAHCERPRLVLIDVHSFEKPLGVAMTFVVLEADRKRNDSPQRSFSAPVRIVDNHNLSWVGHGSPFHLRRALVLNTRLAE
jgi:hypothetical protein